MTGTAKFVPAALNAAAAPCILPDPVTEFAKLADAKASLSLRLALTSAISILSLLPDNPDNKSAIPAPGTFETEFNFLNIMLDCLIN